MTICVQRYTIFLNFGQRYNFLSSGFMQRACKLAIRSVRIPAAWVMGHIVDGEEGMTIDAAWMARVKEIVDYCVKDGLYVLQAQKDY